MLDVMDSAYLREFLTRLREHVQRGGGEGEAWVKAVKAAQGE